MGVPAWKLQSRSRPSHGFFFAVAEFGGRGFCGWSPGFQVSRVRGHRA